jgi:hypothetical protein
MNLFYLHEDPWRSAELHCDKHVVKMIMELNTLIPLVVVESKGGN